MEVGVDSLPLLMLVSFRTLIGKGHRVVHSQLVGTPEQNNLINPVMKASLPSP